MKNKVAIPTILLIFVIAFSFFAFSKESKKEQLSEPATEEAQMEDGIILFYGDGCPHCEIVDEYLEENNMAEQVNFSHKEVYYNRTNAKELEEKAIICGMPAGSIGVPFLWDGEKCLIGDEDIIEFFKQKISI